MSGINQSINIDSIDALHDLNFSELPKGDILRLGINPYSGNVVMAFQDSEISINALVLVFEYIESVISDLSYVNESQASIFDFIKWVEDGSDVVKLGHFAKCPKCGLEPVYSEDDHFLKCGCSDSFNFRFEDLDQAMEVWNFTRKYREAA